MRQSNRDSRKSPLSFATSSCLVTLACLWLPHAAWGAPEPEAEPGTEATSPAATEPSRSMRPGRTGRNLGVRPTPPPDTEAGVPPVTPPAAPPPLATPSPEADQAPQTRGIAATPASTPSAEAPPQSEAFRLEQERRRKEMERMQHEAEETERARRAARLQEIQRQQMEAVRREEEQRRKLLEQLPAPPK